MYLALIEHTQPFLQLCMIVDWEAGKKQEQDLFNKGLECKLYICKKHTYQYGDKGYLKNTWKIKFTQGTYFGHCGITVGRDNGSVSVSKGSFTDTFIIQNLSPYKEYGMVHHSNA